MNAYSRTLPMPGVARPVRESGSSALDRAATAWPAPDPALRVGGAWSPPTGSAVLRSSPAPWPAPDPVLRFDLPAPAELREPQIELIEPALPVPVPDLVAASLAAIVPIEVEPATPPPVTTLPPPVLADAAPGSVLAASADTTVASDRSGVAARLVVGLAAAAGVVAASTLALFAIF